MQVEHSRPLPPLRASEAAPLSGAPPSTRSAGASTADVMPDGLPHSGTSFAPPCEGPGDFVAADHTEALSSSSGGGKLHPGGCSEFGDAIQAPMGASSSTSSRASSHRGIEGSSGAHDTTTSASHLSALVRGEGDKAEGVGVSRYMDKNQSPPHTTLTTLLDKRRKHGHNGASARPPHGAYLSGIAVGGRTGEEDAPPSAEEYCRLSRAIAIHWVSQLMKNPPKAAAMSAYKDRLQHQADHHGGGDSALHDSLLNGMTHDSVTLTEGAATAQSDPSTTTHSFLDAVRSGRGTKSTTPIRGPVAPPPPISPLLHAGSVTAAGNSDPHAAAAAAAAEGSGGAHSSTQCDYSSVELMPCDEDSVPRLLHVLREVSLSCMSLDSLSRAAAEDSTAASGATASGSLGRRRRPDQRGSGSHAKQQHPAPVAQMTGGGPSELADAHETQWYNVRRHFRSAQAYIQNSSEYCLALDTALGSRWRALDTVVTTTALVAAAPAATHYASPAAPHTVIQHSAASDRATASTSTLNRNAAPFQLSAARIAAVSAAAAAGSVPTPVYPDYTPGASAFTGSPHGLASAAAPRPPPVLISGSTPPFAPSPHVASFLERTTPPPLRHGESLLPVFPSTPRDATPSAEARGGVAPAAASAPTVSVAVGATGASAGSQPTHTTAQAQPTAIATASPSGASPSVPFHLESREDMLKRRSAAPAAFYASASHSHAHHYAGSGAAAVASSGGALNYPTSASSPGGLMPLGGITGTYTPVRAAQRSFPVSPLLTYSSPTGGGAAPCPYDYILVLDFEATCEAHAPPGYLHEIIEFPVVLVDTRLQRVVAEFHRFVRPRHKPQLSDFCVDLTGIRQEDIDSAAPLEDVIRQFERWYSHTIFHNARTVFATDGPTDFREFMYVHSVARQGIRFPPLFYQFIDVKQTFSSFFNCQQGKIKAMLDVLNCPLKGRLHSGLDDARNIATIVLGLLQWGCSFCDVPLNRLPLNGLGSSLMGGGVYLPPSTAAATSASSQGSLSPVSKAPPSIDEEY